MTRPVKSNNLEGGQLAFRDFGFIFRDSELREFLFPHSAAQRIDFVDFVDFAYRAIGCNNNKEDTNVLESIIPSALHSLESYWLLLVPGAPTHIRATPTPDPTIMPHRSLAPPCSTPPPFQAVLSPSSLYPPLLVLEDLLEIQNNYGPGLRS